MLCYAASVIMYAQSKRDVLVARRILRWWRNLIQRREWLLPAVVYMAIPNWAGAAELFSPPAELAIQTGHSYQIVALAFSADGKILASAGGGQEKTVRLWDLATRKQIRSINEEADILAFTSEGRLLNCLAAGGRLGVRSVDDGRLVGVVTPGANPVLSGDGRTAAGNSFDGLEILDVGTSNRVKLAKPFAPIALSYSGRWLAARQGPRSAVIWDRLLGREACAFNLVRNHSVPAQFGGNESVLAFVQADKTLTVVNWGHSTKVFQHKLPSEPKALAVVPTAPAWVAVGFETYGQPSGINIYEAPTGKLVRSLLPQTYAGGPICFSPDARYLAVVVWRGGPQITLWDPFSGQELTELRGAVSPITSVVQPAGSHLLISGSSDSAINFWDLAHGRLLRRLSREDMGQLSLALSPDNRTLASAVGVNLGNGDYSNMGQIQRWSLTEGRALSSFEGPKGPLWCLGYSPDGSLLAGGGGETFSRDTNQVYLWDAATGQSRACCVGHTGAVRSLAFTPDSKLLVTAGDDKTVRVWNLPSGSLQRTLNCGIAQRSSIAVSSDGRWIAAGDIDLYVWEMETGRLVLTTQSADTSGFSKEEPRTPAEKGDLFFGTVSAVAFAPRSSVLAVGLEEGEIHFVDVAARRALFHLEGHAASIESLSYGSDGKTLASGSTDGSIRLWNVERREYLASLVAVPPLEYAIVTPDHYYTASRNASRAVAFGAGARSYPFEQFDLYYNRPDKVLEALGGDTMTVSSLRQAWQRRVRKLGFSPGQVSQDLHVPEVTLVSGPLPLAYLFERLQDPPTFVNDVATASFADVNGAVTKPL